MKTLKRALRQFNHLQVRETHGRDNSSPPVLVEHLVRATWHTLTHTNTHYLSLCECVLMARAVLKLQLVSLTPATSKQCHHCEDWPFIQAHLKCTFPARSSNPSSFFKNFLISFHRCRCFHGHERGGETSGRAFQASSHKWCGVILHGPVQKWCQK